MMKTVGILVVFSLAPLFAFAQGASGVFMIVKGDVKVTTKAGATEAAKAGKKVSEGDTIVSGADSRAKIVMSDKNVLNILPESKMTISKYQGDPAAGNQNVELKVEYGKVRAAVEQKYDGDKSKFNIKTPTAVAGVRGTDFITGFNASTRETSVVTFAGSVALGQPGPNGSIAGAVYVNQGEATRQVGTTAPEAPKPMDKVEMQQMNNDSAAETGGAKPDVATVESKQEEKAKEEKKEAKKEEPKKEEAKKEDPKREEAKREEAKREEPKREEPKKETAKREPKRGVASEGPKDSMMPTIDAPPPPKFAIPKPPPTPPPPPPTPHPAVNQNSRVNIIINGGQ